MVLRLKVRSHRPVQESVALCLSVIMLLAGGTILMADNLDPVPRVLILYPYDERLPATTIAGETARTRLIQERAGKIDLFSEFLDLSRFPEEVHIERMATYLANKYSNHRPDVVIRAWRGINAFHRQQSQCHCSRCQDRFCRVQRRQRLKDGLTDRCCRSFQRVRHLEDP